MLRSRITRLTAAAAAVLGLGVVLFSVSSLLAPPSQQVASPPAPAAAAQPQSGIVVLQQRLQRVPGDWGAWAALGSAYLDAGIASADPAYYSKADGALARSLKIRPDDNAAAVTGQAALAASRHNFSTAWKLALSSQRTDPYSAANQGVLADALVELGHYTQAEVELQRMMDLKPSVPAYTRVSYFRELHGDVKGAKMALAEASALAARPIDQAFIERYLGELAFSTGNVTEALRHYDQGLRVVPDNPPLLAARARARVASGQLDAGLQDYAASTTMLPVSTNIAEYAAALRVAGRPAEAAQQDALVRTTYQLLRASGSDVDLELSLYEADHHQANAAVQAAQREYRRRASVHTEDALGWALHAAGRNSEALKHARAAERLSTTNAMFAYHRGMIEQALGKDAAARASLQRALRTNPHFSLTGAAQARQALRKLNR